MEAGFAAVVEGVFEEAVGFEGGGSGFNQLYQVAGGDRLRAVCTRAGGGSAVGNGGSGIGVQTGVTGRAPVLAFDRVFEGEVAGFGKARVAGFVLVVEGTVIVTRQLAKKGGWGRARSVWHTRCTPDC